MRTVALGEVADIERRGIAAEAIHPDEFYLGLEHLRQGGGLAGSARAGTEGISSAKYVFSPEHVLIGKLRPNLAKVALPQKSGVCSTDILPIRPRAGLDRRFLAHYLLTPWTVAWCANRATGASLPRLSPKVLEQLQLPLPSLEEQRRIADILDRTDALLAKRRKVIEYLNALKVAQFSSLLNVASRSRPLGELVRAIDSGTSLKCEARPAEGDELGILKLGAISSGVFREEENKALLDAPQGFAAKMLRPGDVLMSRKNTRDLVGAVALVPRTVRSGLLLPDLIYRIELRQEMVLPQYFQAAMGTKRMRNAIQRIASGSAASMVNISQQRLMELEMPVASMEAQRSFAEFEARRAVAIGRAQAGLKASLLLQRSAGAKLFDG